MNKFKSIKVWALIFCCALLTHIVVGNATDFIPIAQVLSWAPLSYFAVNVAQDFIFKSKTN
jgi:hypothetical protein